MRRQASRAAMHARDFRSRRRSHQAAPDAVAVQPVRRQAARRRHGNHRGEPRRARDVRLARRAHAVAAWFRRRQGRHLSHVAVERRGMELGRRAARIFPGRIRGRRDLRAAQGAARESEVRQHHVLSRGGRALFPADHRASRRGGPARREGRQLQAARHRKAVRDRSGVRKGTQRLHPQVRGRVAGVSDRPFSRQGHGAEHSRRALRQRDVRADLAARIHRQRADHGGGDDRRGRARQVLRADRRVSRHAAEPSFPVARHGGDGAAQFLRCRIRA